MSAKISENCAGFLDLINFTLKTISLTKCLQWRCIATHFIQYCYLSLPAKNSSNHVTRRILTGIEAKCEGSCCEDS